MCTCQQERYPFILPQVGDTIRWFGTTYKVVAIEPPDVVIVQLGNGEFSRLWWPGGPNNTILS